MGDMMHTLLSFLVIYGEEDIDWITCLVDAVEWAAPGYFHQN